MARTAIFKNDLFLAHDPGSDHVESPHRLEVIYQELAKEYLAGRFLFPDFEPATYQQLAANHSKAHIARIQDTAGRPFSILDPDTRASEQSAAAAALAAGAAIHGVTMLAAGEIDNGFALVRPPGHHAEADTAMGFCLYNNVAIAAHHALSALGIERVMIVDWDLHHGNGSQHSFYDTDQVFYFSTHQFPYYPGSGALLETGNGKGEGYTLNVPLTGGQDDTDYAGIFNTILAPVVRQYQPELLLVSAGYDIYQADPLGGMGVTARGFAYMTRVLQNLALEVCQGRLLFCLEGGYNLSGLRDGVVAGLLELAGASTLSQQEGRRLAEATAPSGLFAQVQGIANRYWKL